MTRPRVAALVAEWWPGSHADNLVGRLLDGYELLWVPMRPGVDVVSLHMAEAGPLDVGIERAEAAGVEVYPSASEALTRGGAGLAVDAVVIVPELNDRSGRPAELDARGQVRDRRVELFDEVAGACRDAGRALPVFLDKQLGGTWAEARHVYDSARELGMPLLAGSSVPVTVRFPPLQPPAGAEVEEVVLLSTGCGEPPVFHALELAQSLLERRRGGETGVAAVEFLSGDAFWAAWESGERWSRELEAAALAGVPHATGSPREFYRRSPSPRGPGLTGREEALLVQYNDGLRLAILLLSGYMLRRSLAMRLRGSAAPLVTVTPTGGKLTDQAMTGPFTPPAGAAKAPTGNFDHLAFFVDRFLRDGCLPWPLERTLLTGGVIDALFESRRSGGRVATPHLAFSYEARR